jgi:hypothetical protein
LVVRLSDGDHDQLRILQLGLHKPRDMPRVRLAVFDHNLRILRDGMYRIAHILVVGMKDVLKRLRLEDAVLPNQGITCCASVGQNEGARFIDPRLMSNCVILAAARSASDPRRLLDG